MRIAIFGAAAPFLFATCMVAQTAARPMPQSPSHPPAAAAGEAGQPPMPAHPLTLTQAHEIMRLTGTDQIKERLVDSIMNYFQERLPPFIPQDVKTDLHDSLEKMDVDTPTVAIYQRYLSTEDATKIIAFYETPAGKRLLAATPPMMQEIQRAALKDGQDTSRAVLERHKAEMEAAQKTWEAQHEPKAPTLGPGAPTTPNKPQ